MSSSPNKTALITGASVGLGRAIALELANNGYQLILLARRTEKLQALATELVDTQTHIIACDINDRESLQLELANLPEDFADIDVLVNNAGLALGLVSADKAQQNNNGVLPFAPLVLT